MTEREALLRAVCDNPDDDTPRLVFADWLQENGDEARAEFIRIQIELARGTSDAHLKEREQGLLTTYREEWERPFRQFEVAGSWRRFVFDIHFRRGFVWGLDVNDEERRFAEHAAALFSLAPIQRIAFFHKSQHADLARCPELLRLRELSIDRAGFETEELEVLLRLKFLTNVTRLELIADDDNGHLTPDGLRLLAQSTALPTLRNLDLSYNWCCWAYEPDLDWVAILTEGPLVGQLESLRLRGTDVNDSGAETLARCKRLHSLTHLDLVVNRIGDRGLRALAMSKNLSRLVTLDLRRNLYDAEDGSEVRGCTSETRRILEARFGDGVLIDGDEDS